MVVVVGLADLGRRVDQGNRQVQERRVVGRERQLSEGLRHSRPRLVAPCPDLRCLLLALPAHDVFQVLVTTMVGSRAEKGGRGGGKRLAVTVAAGGREREVLHAPPR
ncbi:hypothetical protein [Streptomyces sp. x-45]|uniref:hypothetical protein n=1 Tax=Streptomyces sp. x-45 TaxID=2789281 RepID=UPI00397F2056